MTKDKDDKPERRPVDLCWLEPRPDCKAPIVVILAKLVEEEGSTQPQLVGDLLPACASALVLYESLGRIISAISLYKLIFPEKSHKYSQCQQEKCVSLYLLALLSLPRVDLSSLVLLPCPTSS